LLGLGLLVFEGLTDSPSGDVLLILEPGAISGSLPRLWGEEEVEEVVVEEGEGEDLVSWTEEGEGDDLVPEEERPLDRGGKQGPPSESLRGIKC
jgi:hypothetical protein